MNLKQLKLSGFKSFVDPTIVPFPGQLVAVVGPNGCGKSNIIDAVRWVMGESSARNLRGESMTDVIFNGSSSRKPVGQASVELVFDNSLGRLAGPFASYADIAIKRVVTRDGESSYYLNGTRCRRKDITDIFLGTGAGARGYSIIGQGTISQLIEAKPDDLRVFLEEAAGVSKYKERRKETLQRIAHTRENLTRVTDIRDELDKQLHRLERQAKSAERYLVLKQEEQLCRAEILALKWQDFIAQQEVKQRELQELALSYEQQQSRLTKANTERILLNEKIHALEDQTQLIQTTYYQLGTEIARLEESIQQHERQKKHLFQEQQQMQADWQSAEEQFTEDKKELLNCQLNAEHLEEQLDQFTKLFKEHEEHYQETQKQKAQWDLRWQEEQKQANNLKRAFQVAQINVGHLEQKKQQTLIRLEKIKLEEESISIDVLQETKNKLQEEQNKLIRQQQSDLLLLQEFQEQSRQLAEQVQKTDQVLHEVQDDFHRTNSDYAALIAAQRAARQGMQGTKKIIEEWADKPRLMDVLQVEPKWQAACERVLDEALNAYVLETFDELWPKRELCERLGESMVTLKISSETLPLHPCLADKIQGKVPDHVYPLDAIYTAEHFEEALSWLPDLSEHHSIITPDGFWLGKGWVKFAPTGYQDELGLLARQQKIHDLSLVVERLQQKMANLRTQRDDCHKQVQKNLSDLAAQQLNVNASNEALRVNNAALSTNEHALLHAKKLKTTCLLEREELQRAIEEISEEHLLINEDLRCLEIKCHDSDLQQEQSMAEQQKYLDALALQSQNFEEARLVLHHAELEYDREKNKMHQLSSRINREQERLNILGERLENVALLCLQTEEPSVALHDQLDLLLLRHTEVELQLTLSKEQGLQLRMELEQLEKNNVHCDLEVRRVQELIAEVRLQEQALEVRASAVQESLNESGLEARALLAHIPEGIKQSVREDDLIALSEKIKRLGAINLAAIDEFSSEQQRKIYLDEQSNDLSQALLTLETAIEKMDKETRVRLENTFAEVNTSFKALFPRLFGGGRAQLELTCENLLEAGIVVMAQPPGKRNSSIHLLSGGEKAMTAVALVFAIFQLNPSPFCMLDEVDAPLDDINVGRFCTMVKEMSQFVQFLFITHNKVTMELADHLMGVTMREPGVSRLVAVDVTQALAME